MICHNCNKEIADDSTFCPECGIPIQVTAGRRCQNCNALMEEDALFCPECGVAVQKKESFEKETRKKSPQAVIIAVILVLGVVLGIYLAPKLTKDKGSSADAGGNPAAAANTGEQSASGQEAEEPQVAQNEPASQEEHENIGETQPFEVLKSWAGQKNKEQQLAQLSPGTQLDVVYMTSIMDSSQAACGMYILDLTNFEEYDDGSAQEVMPASALIGIPIMYTLAEGFEQGRFSPYDTAIFTYTFPNGRGNMKAEQNGQACALIDLLKEALLYSDNNAINSLIDFLSLDLINSTCRENGFTSVDIQRKLISESSNLENFVSAQDVVLMLNAIYQDNFAEINKAFLEEYFKLSTADTANKGMYPACGSYERLLNLNGITETRYNEVGLVKNGEEVFIMAVLTTNGKQENSAPCVTSLASYVAATLRPVQ